MTYGIEIRNASGIERLSPSDFIHRLWTTGQVTALGGFSPPDTFVSVAGMTANDEWLVVVTGVTASWLASGGFYVKNYSGSYSDIIYYSIYRR